MARKENAKQISDLGEFALIDYLTQDIEIKNTKIFRGIGDDAAVYDVGNNICNLITTDLLVEGIHFDLIYTPLKHLGYKSVIVNLSDIYAMNATPKYITVSIALSSKFSLAAIEELYSGIKYACDKYNVKLVGGDTSSSLSGLFISITAVGEANKDEIVYRTGAKANDLICVSGNLGAAYLGLQILEREKKVYMEDHSTQPELDQYDYIIKRFLKPEARRDIIENLKKFNIVPNSMIDISDGLSSELLHLCKQSKLGCKVFEDKIPIDIESATTAEIFRLDPTIPAMNGGEDYELLFTVPLSQKEIVEKIPDVSIIGFMCEDPKTKLIVARNGVELPLIAQGWVHNNDKE